MDTTPTKRYNLVVPMPLWLRVEAAQKRQQEPNIIILLKKFIEIGLLVLEAQDNPNVEFIIREGEKETKIIIL